MTAKPLPRFTATTYEVIQFEYVNHRGESATRTVEPWGVWYGSNEWHPDAQWLLGAFDLDKQANRFFAMRDMTNVRAG